MLDVKDEETLIIFYLALKTNTVATNVSAIGAVQLGLVIDTEDSITVVVLDVTLGRSCSLVDVARECQTSTLLQQVETYLTKPLVFSVVTKLKWSKNEEPG